MNFFICSIHHFDPRVLIHKSSLTHLVPKIKSDIQKNLLNIAPTLKILIFGGGNTILCWRRVRWRIFKISENSVILLVETPLAMLRRRRFGPMELRYFPWPESPPKLSTVTSAATRPGDTASSELNHFDLSVFPPSKVKRTKKEL